MGTMYLLKPGQTDESACAG